MSNRGQVTVNNLNLGQGEFPDVERNFLFMGTAPNNQGKLLSVNTQTDFDSVFGDADSPLKRNIHNAMVNAGQNWQAWASIIPENNDFMAAIDRAMQQDGMSRSPEAIVILDPKLTQAKINAYQAKAHELRATHGRFIFFILMAPGIDQEKQDWAAYQASMMALQNGMAANMVQLVPNLHGNDVGNYAGRLCNRSVSVADSPMRNKTGPALGLGPTPKDKNGITLPEAVLEALSNARYTTIQHYPDYPGTYWANGSLLETPIGDYKHIEYVRPMLKAMRAVRLMAIDVIADRSFNASHASIEVHKTKFSRPLREMSKDVTFMGHRFPGEIYPPDKDAVEIVWKSKSKVDIFLKLRPYECPKTITANLALDLGMEE